MDRGAAVVARIWDASAARLSQDRCACGDWDVKETVRAAMRAKVRRLLTQYGYPPDRQERAVQLVIEQAELFAKDAA